jgi:hypothetical protein
MTDTHTISDRELRKRLLEAGLKLDDTETRADLLEAWHNVITKQS